MTVHLLAVGCVACGQPSHSHGTFDIEDDAITYAEAMHSSIPILVAGQPPKRSHSWYWLLAPVETNDERSDRIEAAREWAEAPPVIYAKTPHYDAAVLPDGTVIDGPIDPDAAWLAESYRELAEENRAKAHVAYRAYRTRDLRPSLLERLRAFLGR